MRRRRLCASQRSAGREHVAQHLGGRLSERDARHVGGRLSERDARHVAEHVGRRLGGVVAQYVSRRISGELTQHLGRRLREQLAECVGVFTQREPVADVAVGLDERERHRRVGLGHGQRARWHDLQQSGDPGDVASRPEQSGLSARVPRLLESARVLDGGNHERARGPSKGSAPRRQAASFDDTIGTAASGTAGAAPFGVWRRSRKLRCSVRNRARHFSQIPSVNRRFQPRQDTIPLSSG